MRLSQACFVRFKEIGELTKKYANLPDAFIKRRMEQIEYRTPRGFPQYLPRTLMKKDYYIGKARPWTQEFILDSEKRRPKVYIEPIKDWTIFKGDKVEILVGKDKGKQGIVVQVIQERNWVIVEGLNCKLEKFGETRDHPGMFIQTEKPLLVTTEVSLVDPTDMLAAPVEWRYTEEGDKVRVSIRSGRIIPIPKQTEETYDYKTRGTYIESEKDTKKEDVLAVTFKPELETFEMGIMKEMGIKEDRIPAVTYWY